MRYVKVRGACAGCVRRCMWGLPGVTGERVEGERRMMRSTWAAIECDWPRSDAIYCRFSELLLHALHRFDEVRVYPRRDCLHPAEHVDLDRGRGHLLHRLRRR